MPVSHSSSSSSSHWTSLISNPSSSIPLCGPFIIPPLPGVRVRRGVVKRSDPATSAPVVERGEDREGSLREEFERGVLVDEVERALVRQIKTRQDE